MSNSLIKTFAISAILSLICMSLLLAAFFTYKPNSILGWSVLYLITFPVIFALLMLVANKWSSMKAIILTPFSILFLYLMCSIPHLFIPEEFSSIGEKLALKANVSIIPIALKTDFWGVGSILKDFGAIHREKKIFFEFGKPLKSNIEKKQLHSQIVEFIESKLNEWTVL